MFDSIHIMENALLTETYEDWSRVRSAGRARRRMKQGHRQNVVIRERPQQAVYRIGDAFVAHPAMVDALRKQISATQKG